MANKIELPDDVELAAKVIDVESQKESRRDEMGWFGKIFGGAQEKPGNIAACAIVVSILVIVSLAFFTPDDPRVPIAELYTLFGGIVTLALGYVFGRSGP